jgi:hypothetical protein
LSFLIHFIFDNIHEFDGLNDRVLYGLNQRDIWVRVFHKRGIMRDKEEFAVVQTLPIVV